MGPAAVSPDDLLLRAVVELTAEEDELGLLRRVAEGLTAVCGADATVAAIFGVSGRVSDIVVHRGSTGAEGVFADESAVREVFHSLAALPTPTRLGEDARLRSLLGETVAPDRPLMILSLSGEAEPGEDDPAVEGRIALAGPPGAGFDEADEERASTFLEVAERHLVQVRDRARTKHRLHALEATASVAEILAPPVRIDEGLALVAQVAVEVLGASAVAVLQESPASGLPDIVAVAGEHAREIPDVLFRIPVGVLRATPETDVVFVPDGRDRLVALVPLNAHLSFSGVLLCLLEGSRMRLRYDEVEALGSLADQIALALDRAQALLDRQELALVSDRDRIARDLHDVVIQRLFATGLRLQGAKRLMPDDDGRGRLADAVADLDLTISDIRTTIFNLQHTGTRSAREELRAVVREYIPLLGFTPVVRTTGPVDTVVDKETAEHLRAVLRESLSNVMRHAEASSVVVEVEAAPDYVLIRVSDDGRGLPDDLARESGLRNLRTRAQGLGGRASVRNGATQGAVVEFWVPLAGASEESAGA